METDEQIIPTPVTFKNPLRQWLYDNRVSQRRLARNARIAIAQFMHLLSEDYTKLDHVQIQTLYKVRVFTGVDLAAWYYDQKTHQAS